MNPGAIWWGQIGNSLSLLSRLTNSIRDYRSVVLALPENLPWEREFRENAAIRRTALGGNRGLRSLRWRERQDPGDFIFRELCSREEQLDYYPGDSRAAYLGSREDLELHELDIWVTGIHRKEDLVKWTTFLAEYEKVSAALDQRAVFVLEYDGPTASNPGVEQLIFQVEDYDCRVFCLESGAALKNAELREYQAELALRIGGGDPEFSWALLLRGEDLIRDPVRTALEVIAGSTGSQGRPFAALTEQQITSAAWRAALVIFFPLLEQWRMDFVIRHESELRRHLPITNSNGEKVTDPYDLEIGALYFISGKPGVAFPLEEKAQIDLCREARNLLAHNKVLSREHARQILKL